VVCRIRGGNLQRNRLSHKVNQRSKWKFEIGRHEYSAISIPYTGKDCYRMHEKLNKYLSPADKGTGHARGVARLTKH
jgi:hypothetical protein